MSICFVLFTWRADRNHFWAITVALAIFGDLALIGMIAAVLP
jgi:hypothetical protein